MSKPLLIKPGLAPIRARGVAPGEESPEGRKPVLVCQQGTERGEPRLGPGPIQQLAMVARASLRVSR